MKMLITSEGVKGSVACRTYRHPAAVDVIAALLNFSRHWLEAVHQFDASLVIGSGVCEAVLVYVHRQQSNRLWLISADWLQVLHYKQTTFAEYIISS